jgi:hypothetical protein
MMMGTWVHPRRPWMTSTPSMSGKPRGHVRFERGLGVDAHEYPLPDGRMDGRAASAGRE